jgi:hypothetical protein
LHCHHTKQAIPTDYGPSLLNALPKTLTQQPSLNKFMINNYPLRGMQQHSYQQHQQIIKTNFAAHTTPNIASILPSLLSPLTSISHLSLSQ